MNSDYTRALVDAAEKAEESAKAWRIRRDDSRKGKDRDDYLYCDARATEAAEFAARLRAWAKATPTPPPDAGERVAAERAHLTALLAELPADFVLDRRSLEARLEALGKPSPPPPAGEVEAWPAHWPKRYNGCSDPCDALFFACACGAWHGAEEVAEFEREYGPRKPPPAPQGDDETTLRDALDRLVQAAWRRKNAPVPFSIPADEKRDADIILERAITELLALRANGGPR
jgi:hypothetical protein